MQYATSECVYEQEKAVLLAAFAMRLGVRIGRGDRGVLEGVVGKLRGWMGMLIRSFMFSEMLMRVLFREGGGNADLCGVGGVWG